MSMPFEEMRVKWAFSRIMDGFMRGNVPAASIATARYFYELILFGVTVNTYPIPGALYAK